MFTGGVCLLSKSPEAVADSSIAPQGYELSITPDGVKIKYSDAAGEFYARMTLRQLATVGQNKKTVSYSCCEIKDSPAFLWRGVMLDEARHFSARPPSAIC